ncbi:hypothetical protein ACA910_011132 [Epithemia clementina (nom. ined.)]
MKRGIGNGEHAAAKNAVNAMIQATHIGSFEDTTDRTSYHENERVSFDAVQNTLSALRENPGGPAIGTQTFPETSSTNHHNTNNDVFYGHTTGNEPLTASSQVSHAFDVVKIDRESRGAASHGPQEAAQAVPLVKDKVEHDNSMASKSGGPHHGAMKSDDVGDNSASSSQLEIENQHDPSAAKIIGAYSGPVVDKTSSSTQSPVPNVSSETNKPFGRSKFKSEGQDRQFDSNAELGNSARTSVNEEPASADAEPHEDKSADASAKLLSSAVKAYKQTVATEPSSTANTAGEPAIRSSNNPAQTSTKQKDSILNAVNSDSKAENKSKSRTQPRTSTTPDGNRPAEESKAGAPSRTNKTPPAEADGKDVIIHNNPYAKTVNSKFKVSITPDDVLPELGGDQAIIQDNPVYQTLYVGQKLFKLPVTIYCSYVFQKGVAFQ